MAEGEGEVIALREALHYQNLVIEKLKAELEEERRAAASGVDEALAMILRLQAEKAAERMEALQFRRIAEEKIQHDEDSLAFLKGVIFHQEMEINSLKCQIHACKHKLLSICVDDPYAREGDVFDLPWLSRSSYFFGNRGLRSMSRRNTTSLPAIRLEELCSELEFIHEESSSSPVGNERRPVRSTSDVAEVSEMDKERCRQRVTSYATRSSPHAAGSVQDKFELPESLEGRVPTKSNGRVSPEIISEDEDLISTNGSKCTDHKNNSQASDSHNVAWKADVEHIKGSVRNLENELGRMRDSNLSRGNEQVLLLTQINEKLDAIQYHMQQQKQQHLRGEERSTSRQIHINVEENSSKRRSSHDELLMTYFIEAMLSISL